MKTKCMLGPIALAPFRTLVRVVVSLLAGLAEPGNSHAAGPPIIIQPPSSQTVFVGSDVSFRVVADGQGSPLTYRWLSSPYTLGDTNRVSGIYSNLLTIRNVRMEDTAAYWCLVQDVYGYFVQTPPAALWVLPSGLEYETNNNAITITGYTGPGGGVSIPHTIAGLPVASIGNDAFYQRFSLTSVTIPDSVTVIGTRAFCSCTNLTNVVVGNNVATIGSLAFSSCSSLATITLPTSLITIRPWAFQDCFNLHSIFIPDSVTTIEGGVFSRCSSLAAITLPTSLTNIGDSAFQYCADLSSITIPDSVTTIGGQSFLACLGLTQVTIPESVTEIGDHAFRSCINLVTLAIPRSVTTIGDGPFADCQRLRAIDVDPRNPAYVSLEGVLFDTEQTRLIQYPAGKTNTTYTIPEIVTTIGESAFTYCTSLTQVTIPENVTIVGDGAFAACYSLTGVYFEGSAPTAGAYLFSSTDNAIVYYLPGTTGWGLAFGGLPTALWRPHVRTADASFGVISNQFGFSLAWASGQTVVVETTETLASPVWIPVATNTLATASFYFSDPDLAAYPSRFYRIRAQ